MKDGNTIMMQPENNPVIKDRLALPVTRSEEYMWAILSELKTIRELLERTDVTRRGLYGEAG